jgi:rSAM/selenodomain-associated transferase 1
MRECRDMRNHARVSVIIPALNEAAAIGRVIADIPAWVDEILVADNGSTDDTAPVAQAAGARVVAEPQRGYGKACLTAIAALAAPQIVVFLDGDYSDNPKEMERIVDPVAEGLADLVIGSRVQGDSAPGALTLPQRFGNWLACRLMRYFWDTRFTDLGPFRAIRFDVLQRLYMADEDYGWTVEMQVKAVKAGLRCREVPVSYKPRIGRSKVSGTLRGVWGAGVKILGTIFREATTAPVPDDSPRKGTRIVLFSRYPEAGRTKTRLIPALGADGAAQLQTTLTRRTLKMLENLVSRDDCQVEVRFEGGSSNMMRRLFGANWPYVPQGDGDLGEKLTRAMNEAFAAGVAHVVFIGVDCPELTPADLAATRWLLDHHQAVIGPAADGGYYLLGLREPAPAVFDEIDWGGPRVLAQTRDKLSHSALSSAELRALHDLDRPEDLARHPELHDA